MESKGELKENDIKNCTCYCFNIYLDFGIEILIVVIFY